MKDLARLARHRGHNKVPYADEFYFKRARERESDSVWAYPLPGARGSARRALQLTEINLIEMQRHLKFDVVELEGSIYMLHIHIHTYTSAFKWFVP